MKASGFTLIEMMIVVAVAGALAAVALPNMRSLVLKTRLKTVSSDMHSSLMLARSEAVKRNAVVSVVPVDTSDWSKGWSVKSGTTVLSTQDPYTSITISPRSASYATKTVNSVAFQGTGREGSSDGIAFVATVTGEATIYARCVVVDPSGRPTVRVDKNLNVSNGCN